MRIYSKAPVGATRAPGVVVIMHGPGLDAFVEDRVDDLARHGYAAAAPDLYHRQPADVDKIDAELSRHGKAHEFHRYEGAGHAFLNFTNADRYRPSQAKDAWEKMLAFLGRHLKK